MIEQVVPIGTIQAWKRFSATNGIRILPENRVHSKYSEITKNKVWNLLKQYPVRYVQKIMEGRIARGTLNYWARRQKLGLPIILKFLKNFSR